MALLDELIHGKATVAVRDELIDITGDDAGLRLLGINILLPGNCCRFERWLNMIFNYLIIDTVDVRDLYLKLCARDNLDLI